MDISPVNVSIVAPPEVFNVSSDRVGYVLTYYSTPNLFQVKEPQGYNESISGDFEFVADSAVVGLNVSRDDRELNNLTDPVIITLQSLRALSGQVRYRAAPNMYYCHSVVLLNFRIGLDQSVLRGILAVLMVWKLCINY